jgi:hypothetical protein
LPGKDREGCDKDEDNDDAPITPVPDPTVDSRRMPDNKSEGNDSMPGNRKPKDQKCHNGGISKHKNKERSRVETHQDHTDGTHLSREVVTYLPVVLRLKIHCDPHIE